MPVAHRHIRGGIHTTLSQQALQFAGLLLGDAPERRASTDGAVGLLGLAAAQGADQPGQRLLEGRAGQPNDLRISEEVVQKRTDVLNPLGAPQIQKNYADA